MARGLSIPNLTAQEKFFVEKLRAIDAESRIEVLSVLDGYFAEHTRKLNERERRQKALLRELKNAGGR